jgi:hypothetical protein
MMEKNVGGYDRIARGVLATLSTAVGVAGLAALGPLTATAGVLALGASAGLWFNVLTQRCLGNQLLGIDTCGAENC